MTDQRGRPVSGDLVEPLPGAVRASGDGHPCGAGRESSRWGGVVDRLGAVDGVGLMPDADGTWCASDSLVESLTGCLVLLKAVDLDC